MAISWVSDPTGAIIETTDPRIAYFGYEFSDNNEARSYAAFLAAA